MARSRLLLLALWTVFLVFPLPTLRAEFTALGEVSPANPSTWTSSTYGYVGIASSGTLTVDGGSDLLAYHVKIGQDPTGTGVVTVSGAGSTWTAGSILDMGFYGSGALSISSGSSVSSSSGQIGCNSGSTGTVTVSGAGSTWTNTSSLLVGYSGSGSLYITGGGSVSNSDGRIGYYASAKGTVTVDGAGSTWTNGGALSVGLNGSGTLNISGGGAVAAPATVSVGSASLLAIDVGRGSLLAVGGGIGTITNNGTIRFRAGAGVAAGSAWSPISSDAWSGGGTYQALGGTLNTDTHAFTASSVATSASGSAITIDPASQQRVLVNDGPTGWSLGESFLATASSSTLTCTATAISGGTLTSLSGLLPAGDAVLSG
jgi:T5SS/PEP-CTERM-associated repeat protein